MLGKFVICYVLIFLHVYFLNLCCSNTQPEYGSFSINVSKVVTCKGPKRYDCSNNTVKLKNEDKLQLIMDVKETVIPNRGKMIISINGQLLARLQIKRPCDHVFLKPIMQKLLNVTQECEIKKGVYNMNFDVEKLAQEYYGGLFFYGHLRFEIVTYNENCNCMCIIVEATLYPKNSPSRTR